MEELLVDEVLELLENDSDKQLKAFLNELNISDNARPHEVDASLYSHIYTKVTNNGRNENTTC